MTFEGVLVPGSQTERRSERPPLVVVEQGPVEVSPHVDAVVHRVVHAGYGVEGVVAGAAGHDAEGQQDADGTDVGDQQVEVTGPPDFGVPVLNGVLAVEDVEDELVDGGSTLEALVGRDRGVAISTGGGMIGVVSRPS